jgi:glucosylceramidase
MAHFSRFMRPGARRIGLDSTPEELMATACKNPDGSIALAVLNQGEQPVRFQVEFNKRFFPVTIPGRAIQTLVIR